MRTFFATILVLAGGCDSGMDPTDAGDGMDAGQGTVDAGPEPDGGGTNPDAGMVGCPPGQHACGSGCLELLPNNPSNGCALGCGEACEVADAICNPDGTCGETGCEPMTCESLGANCGLIDNGCGGRRNCGACDVSMNEMCVDGQCIVVCSADPHEPNDTIGSPDMISTLGDNPDSSASITNGSISGDTDEDWYRFNITNVTDFGDPEIEVRLTGIPAGEDYDLGVWYVCSDSDGGPTECGSGRPNTLGGNRGCISDAVGNDTVQFDSVCDPNGAILIRVHPAGWNGSCSEYRLDISVI